MGTPVNAMAGGPISAQSAMAYRRSSPYGNARQMMLQRKQQYLQVVAGPAGMAPSLNNVSLVPCVIRTACDETAIPWLCAILRYEFFSSLLHNKVS